MMIVVLGSGMAHAGEGDAGRSIEGMEEGTRVLRIEMPPGDLAAVVEKGDLMIGERQQFAARSPESVRARGIGGKGRGGDEQENEGGRGFHADIEAKRRPGRKGVIGPGKHLPGVVSVPTLAR